MSYSGTALAAKLAEALGLHRLGQFARAEQVCAQILEQQPNHFHALQLMGVLALQRGDTRRGVELLGRAIAIDRSVASAHVNLGNGLRDLKRPDEALEHYDRAIALQPELAEAHSNRGNALTELKRPQEALASYDNAIALRPGFADPYSNRARALIDLGRPEEALEGCDKAIALKPNLASAWGNRALALNKLKRYEEAAKAYATLLEIEPQHPFVKGFLLFQKMQSCEWTGISSLIEDIEKDIGSGRLAAEPFGWQGAATSPQSLLLCAEQFSKKRFPANIRRFPKSGHREKIRVGYVSGEFREHATALLLVGVLEQHDKNEFEIFAFDNGRDDGSETRRRIAGAVHRIVDISNVSDSQAVSQINSQQIDILVDLNGYFGGDRTLVFAQRPAPIQVNYLGFPGTLGARYIDYIIADRHVIPPSHKPFYTEKIVYLPNCYQPNDGGKKIGTEFVSRAHNGLPENAFVFCCFNNNYKILPGIFDIWMRILARVEGSVLWLLEDNEGASQNLKREAGARGVDPARLIFAKRMPLSGHLARHRCADLFLDTLPYNAHTTASDALWAGLPVLTTLGGTFPGRVAASLLHAMHLPELVTGSLPDYERLAVLLANDRERLAAVKVKLGANRLTTPLFDTKSYTRDIEAGYRAMVRRHRAGLPPDHIVIPGA